MTEAEWLSCDDACRMLAFLGSRASARKRRLHVCGGCRQIWDLLYDNASCAAVEVAERFADGAATDDDLHKAEYHAEPAEWMLFLKEPEYRYFGPDRALPDYITRLIAMGILTEEAYRSGADRIEVADPDGLNRVRAASKLAEWCVGWPMDFDDRLTEFFNQLAERVRWPGGPLIRDLFGNPFRPVDFDFRWRTADTTGLATAIYEDRAYDRLPLLSDALMDAGCDDADILAHCRSDGFHVRGCWVVDLVLGKG
jgi:hypothetical protein